MAFRIRNTMLESKQSSCSSPVAIEGLFTQKIWVWDSNILEAHIAQSFPTHTGLLGINCPETILEDIGYLYYWTTYFFNWISKLDLILNSIIGTIHEKVNGKGYFYSWKDPRTATVEEDWLGGRNYCRQRCMDLVSLETSTENEFIKRRIVEGKVRSIILVFHPLQVHVQVKEQCSWKKDALWAVIVQSVKWWIWPAQPGFDSQEGN